MTNNIEPNFILKDSIYTSVFSIVLLINTSLYAQKINLKLFSIDRFEQSVLDKIDYSKTHNTTQSLQKEVKFVSNDLKKRGFFFNTIDSVTKNIAFFSLKKKYETIIINSNLKIDTINIQNLENYFQNKTIELEEKGELFSEISLVNITTNNNLIFANLKTKQAKLRTIDRMIVKGYNKIANSYLKHLLDLKRNKTINSNRLKEISNSLNSLSFATETKPPETLFTKDSTLLYIYLKEIKSNTFEGLLNFGSEENKIVFSGFLNLELNNIFHRGENLTLNWKANGNDSQNFSLHSNLPYILNTPISSELDLNIHKQDSSFLNTKFSGKLLYSINRKTETGLSYDSETSQNTLTNTNDSINTYRNNFLGVYFRFKSLRKNVFNEHKYHIELNPSFGKRKTSLSSINQIKINTNISYIFNVDKRNSILIKGHYGNLISDDTILTNELFRIGGYQNLRGIEQESVFTKSYSILNSEYRFKTSEDAFLHSIIDVGNINNFQNQIYTSYSLGLGYKFKLKSSLININYVINNNTSDVFTLSNSKVNFTFLNFF